LYALRVYGKFRMYKINVYMQRSIQLIQVARDYKNKGHTGFRERSTAEV